MSERDGGPAFPRVEPPSGDEGYRAYFGMSLRDWFAGKAIEGCDPGNLTEEGMLGMVEGAYLLADAMLKERAK